MVLYLQICGAVLLAVILMLTLKNTSKDISTVLSVVVCCIVVIAALQYLKPVLTFLQTLENLGKLDHSLVNTMLKATGIGIISEIANLVCKDAGSESMGKSLQLMGTAVILYLSMPLFTALIELLQKILGEL
jgi:stage III sporulation protein AD